jgi:3-hydroxyacyl-CoA dehydrogenase / enoyl-CoA hydratase / 3-hydroxybutyryl-CoA epimerase
MDVLSDRVLELGPKVVEAGPYRNFKLTHDGDGIAWLLFDRADASANTLSADVIAELDLVLAALESQRPAGIVIRSPAPMSTNSAAPPIPVRSRPQSAGRTR